MSGHIYIFAFIALRLVTDGLAISKRNDPADANATGAIINSIGLSPLLLATAGFLNEARFYILDYPSNKAAKKIGRLFELVLHVLVVTGIVLLALGRTRAAEAATSSNANRYRGLEYGGAVLLLLAWLSVCAVALLTAFTAYRQKRPDQQRRGAGLLAYEIVMSLVFTGIRVIYTMVYTFDSRSQVQPTTASFVIYFLLLFLSQLIAVIIIAVALVITRNMNQEFFRTTRPGDTSTVHTSTDGALSEA